MPREETQEVRDERSRLIELALRFRQRALVARAENLDLLTEFTATEAGEIAEPI